MMMIMIITPFGHYVGLWAPSSNGRDVSTSITYIGVVCSSENRVQSESRASNLWVFIRRHLRSGTIWFEVLKSCTGVRLHIRVHDAEINMLY
jgi:hypothetical protein